MRALATFAVLQLLLFPGLANALTYNDDLSIPFPEKVEDLQDILPLQDTTPLGIGSQIQAGVYTLFGSCGREDDAVASTKRCVYFLRAGFGKNGLGSHPYLEGIKKEEFLSKKEFHVVVGSTVSFYNASSHPLWVTSDNTLMGNKPGGQPFDQGSASPRGYDTQPSFQFTFQTPGTYEFYNKLYPYLRGIIVVESSAQQVQEKSVEPKEKTASTVAQGSSGSPAVVWKTPEIQIPKKALTAAPLQKKAPVYTIPKGAVLIKNIAELRKLPKKAKTWKAPDGKMYRLK